MSADLPKSSAGESNANGGGSVEDPTPISAVEAARLLAEEGNLDKREPDVSQNVFLTMLQRAVALGKKPLVQWKRFVRGALYLKRLENLRKSIRQDQRQEAFQQEIVRVWRVRDAAKACDPDLADRALRMILKLPRRELEIFLLVEWAGTSLEESCRSVYGDVSEASLNEGRRRLRSARRHVAERVANWTTAERSELLSEASRKRIRDVLGDVSGLSE